MEETLAKRREYASKIRELEEKVQAGETDIKICYWTFDDGPTRLTTQVLDKAKELGVHVTFFTSHEANESEDEPEMLRREFAEGHAVANHTYSHQFAAMGNLYQKTEGLIEMIQKQDEWVYECTGFHTEIFRYPGGSAWAKALLGTDRPRPSRKRATSGSNGRATCSITASPERPPMRSRAWPSGR